MRLTVLSLAALGTLGLLLWVGYLWAIWQYAMTHKHGEGHYG